MQRNTETHMDRDCQKETGKEKSKETQSDMTRWRQPLEEAFWWAEIQREIQNRDRKR